MQRPLEFPQQKQQPLNVPKLKAGNPLDRLDISRKLALSALAFALPIATLLVVAQRGRQADISFVKTELRGLDIFPAYQSIQTSLTSFVNLSNEDEQAKAAQAATQVDQAMNDLIGQARQNRFPVLAQQVEEAQKSWQKLRSSPLDASGQKLTAELLDLSDGQLQPIQTTLLDESKLILDPASATYFAVISNLNLLPQVRVRLGHMYLLAETAERLDDEPMSQERVNVQIRQEAAATSNLIDDAVDSLERVQKDSKVSEAFNLIIPELRNVQAALDDISAAPLDSNVLGGTTPAALEAAGDSLEKHLTSTQASVRELLRDRLRTLQTAAASELTSILIITILAALLLLAVARTITQPLGRLSRGAQRIAQGDYNVQFPVTSQDELGLLSSTFNQAVTQLRENDAQSRERLVEAEQLQSNIGEFLNVTMDIAEGDLTKRGKVTEDVLGNVVDSINLMTDELAETLKGVRGASKSVYSGSQTVRDTTEQINQGAQLAAGEITRMSERVQQMNAAIQDMALKAQSSAQTARQALEASQQGQAALNSTLEGMQNVRREVQGVAKRIKNLGDRSLEIQEIVDTISQIAQQTHLLAVNASIEAAGAGQAGGRFSIVADAVRKLSDTANQATARVATLIKNVQTEIQDVIIGVEESTREVEQGYRVAGNAGEHLEQIGELTEEAAQLAEQVATTTQAQAQGVEQMSQALAQVSTITQQATTSVEQGRQAAQQLEQLAQELNASLARFRLPV